MCEAQPGFCSPVGSFKPGVIADTARQGYKEPEGSGSSSTQMRQGHRTDVLLSTKFLKSVKCFNVLSLQMYFPL